MWANFFADSIDVAFLMARVSVAAPFFAIAFYAPKMFLLLNLGGILRPLGRGVFLLKGLW